MTASFKPPTGYYPYGPPVPGPPGPAGPAGPAGPPGTPIARVAAGAGPTTIAGANTLLAKTAITVGGDIVTLPSSADVGTPVVVKDESLTAGTNPITIVTPDGSLIDGGMALIIQANGGSVELYSASGAWFSLFRNPSTVALLSFSADCTQLAPGDVGASVVQGITISRATVARTRTGLAAVAQSIPANHARIYWDGGSVRGLLLEETRTNLIASPTSPQTAPPWTTNGTQTPNYAPSPDPTLLATRLQATTNSYAANQTVTATAGT